MTRECLLIDAILLYECANHSKAYLLQSKTGIPTKTTIKINLSDVYPFNSLIFAPVL